MLKDLQLLRHMQGHRVLLQTPKNDMQPLVEVGCRAEDHQKRTESGWTLRTNQKSSLSLQFCFGRRLGFLKPTSFT